MNRISDHGLLHDSLILGLFTNITRFHYLTVFVRSHMTKVRFQLSDETVDAK
jgi:hypothetical protein